MHDTGMPMSLLCFLLLGTQAEGVAQLRVCTTEEMGFDMVRTGSGLSAGDVTSDEQLYGYDVEMRQQVLTTVLNVNYSIRVLASYGELQVAVRKDECDIGWAPFFVKGNRERCVEKTPNADPSPHSKPNSRAPLRGQSTGCHGAAASTTPLRI